METVGNGHPSSLIPLTLPMTTALNTFAEKQVEHPDDGGNTERAGP